MNSSRSSSSEWRCTRRRKPTMRTQAGKWISCGNKWGWNGIEKGTKFTKACRFWIHYCWWLKSCTTKDDDYPIICRVSYIPGGAGFLPSTVSPPKQLPRIVSFFLDTTFSTPASPSTQRPQLVAPFWVGRRGHLSGWLFAPPPGQKTLEVRDDFSGFLDENMCWGVRFPSVAQDMFFQIMCWLFSLFVLINLRHFFSLSMNLGSCRRRHHHHHHDQSKIATRDMLFETSSPSQWLKNMAKV